MATFQIERLKLRTCIGVHPHELRVPQTLFVDLSYAIDSAKVAESDALSDTVDYDALTQAITEFTQNHNCKLIEAFSARLFQYLKTNFPISDLELTLTKPGALANAQAVKVVQR